MSYRVLSLVGIALALASSALAKPASAVGEAGAALKDSGATMAPRPQALVGTEIEDKLGAQVPLDVKLTNDEGKAVALGDYFSLGDRREQAGEERSGALTRNAEGVVTPSETAKGGAPVLLTLGYYECPMLCSLVLNSTLEALKKVSLDVGEDFSVVTVSIDPKETTALAKQKRDNYLSQYDREGAAAGWRFHTADEAEVKRLAEAIGFNYRWDEGAKQYAHGAGIFFLSPDGTLTRTLYGLSYSPTDVKFALMEASRGEVGSVTDRILMSCFQYTPDGQKYGVYVWGVMRLGGVLTLLFLGTMLFVLWRRERRNGSSRDDERAGRVDIGTGDE